VILNPDDAGFGTIAGAAVEVFVNVNSVGFATEVSDTGHKLFRYLIGPNQLPTDDFHADSQGWLHYVKAAVRIFDGQRPAQGKKGDVPERVNGVKGVSVGFWRWFVTFCFRCLRTLHVEVGGLRFFGCVFVVVAVVSFCFR
jgi:hypothetical protein